MIESLRDEKETAPYIVEFNPWQWAAQDQVAEAFFRELSIALGRKDAAKEANQTAAKLSAYAAYIRVGSSAVSGVGSLPAKILFVAGLLSIGGSQIGFERVKHALTYGGIAALLLAAFLEWGTETMEHLAAAFSAFSKLRERNLQETRDELSKLLRGLKSPILIVIDDVDRLSADEIKLVFQLVKANADFPNLVYLLLFQRDIVEESLKKITNGSGRDFLEKIVQLGFDVPSLEQSRLQKVLFNGLNEILSDEEVGKHFDQNRWGNLFIPGLSPYFQTLRDVYRFLSVLEVQVSSMKPRGTFEVNPIDLIALEVLRVFEPDVYRLLPQAKAPLTKVHDPRLKTPSTETEIRARVEALIEAAQPNSKEHAREIIRQLFPEVAHILGATTSSGGDEHYLFRELRACHPDVFDRYFYLAIPERDLSQADLNAILAVTGNRDQLVALFDDLKKRDLLTTALDRLEAYKQEIDLANAVPFVTALFDIGDDLPDEQSGLFGSPSWMHATRIIHWYLKKEPDANTRFKWLSEAMHLTRGIYLPAMKTALEADRAQKAQNPDAFLVDEPAVAKLKAICVEKIRATAETDKLAVHPRLAWLLNVWGSWASPKEPKSWIDKLTQSKDGIVTFLTAFTFKSTSAGLGDYVAREHWHVLLKTVELYIDPSVLEQRVKDLQPKGTNEAEIRALGEFQKALRRRREGKSEDPPFWDS